MCRHENSDTCGPWLGRLRVVINGNAFERLNQPIGPPVCQGTKGDAIGRRHCPPIGSDPVKAQIEPYEL